VCIRYTTRIRTCSATYVAPPAPARRILTPASERARALIALETFDEQESVFGLWRATGVAFESHGERTLLEVRHRDDRRHPPRRAGGDGLVTYQFDEHEPPR
jgi:hypothetical protein